MIDVWFVVSHFFVTERIQISKLKCQMPNKIQNPNVKTPSNFELWSARGGWDFDI